jgi:hypothetical protein
MNQQPPNIFDNCFSDELSRGSCSGNSIYENQMAEQTQSSSRQKADHLRQVRDQVKMDFDAVDRIAQVCVYCILQTVYEIL